MEKPGYKSTEFWLTLLAIVVSALLASGVFGPEGGAYKVLAFAASALATMGYSYGRSLTKAAHTQAKGLVDAAKENVARPPST